jgi:hypothetical protein
MTSIRWLRRQHGGYLVNKSRYFPQWYTDTILAMVRSCRLKHDYEYFGSRMMTFSPFARKSRQVHGLPVSGQPPGWSMAHHKVPD